MAGRSRKYRCRAGLFAAALALGLGGCAGAGGPGALSGEPLEPSPATGAATVAVEAEPIAPAGGVSSAAPSSSSAAQPRDGARAAAPAQPSGKPKELPYPNFGTPPQIGQTPVLTTEERSQMQTDLETMAKEREAKARRELEEEDQGQP